MRSVVLCLLIAGSAVCQSEDSGTNRKRMLIIGYGKGIKGESIGGQYITYNRNRTGLQWPSCYSVDFLEIKDSDESGSLTTFSFSFKGLYIRPESSLAFSLGIAIPLGQEAVDKGTKQETNFFVGVELRQTALYLPVGNGIVVEAGFFEKYLYNSELYPWDVGVRGGVGMQF